MPDYIWKLQVEYPEDAYHEHPWIGVQLNPNWEPPNWEPDDEFLQKYGKRFFWPKVSRYYLSRSSAVDRANLLEFYGAKVALLRSLPLEFEVREFKHVHRKLRLVPAR